MRNNKYQKQRKMKNYTTNIIKATALGIVIIGLASCTSTKPEDTKKVAEVKNEEKFDNNKNKEKDAQFLVDAAEINREEVSLAQLAQQKGKMTHITELSKMMEKEHAKSLSELTVLAKAKGISLPTAITEDSQEDYKKLNEKTGHDFEKMYCEIVVRKHKSAINLFEKASTDSNDADIKAWAALTLPALRAHLDDVLMCQRSCDNM